MYHASNEKWQIIHDGKSQTTKSREKNTYKYLGILEANTIKQVEMKEKIKKEYLRRTRKLLETKLYCRNFVKGINSWAVPLVWYSELFLKWTREELKQMDQRTRKLMTMHKALHPWCWQTISVKKGVRKGTCQDWRQRGHIDTTRRLHRKAQRKTHYSLQKQY